MRGMLPALVEGTVVRQDPDNYRLFVSIDAWGGQVPFLSVDVSRHGHSDAVRGHWPPLPAIGTRGRISFVRGDDRTGRWEGASTPALNDSSPHSPSHGNADYRAGYAGDWDWIGEDGTVAKAFADGGTLLLGGTMPVPTRHTVAADGSRQRTPFTAQERNPKPPGPYPLTVALASGFLFSVSASGGTALTAPAGQSLTLAVAGGASITLNADGSVTVVTAGQPITLAGGGAAQPVKLADGSDSTILRAQ